MPYKPLERQYRSFTASNFQPVQQEGDEPSEESFRVRGYYTTFNDEYLLYERTKYWPAEYEQIDPHALDDCDMSDVIMQYDHEGPVLARQRNGSLVLGTDDHGAWCEADLSGCQQARNLYESIKNGLVVEMSFGFVIDSDDDSDGYTTFKDEDGDWHTTITRIRRVYDVSAVGIPANPGTEIDEIRKRSYLAARIEADRKAEQESQAEEPEVVEQRSAETDEVSEPVMAETEAFGIDIDAIVEQVMERMSQQPTEAPEDVPEEPEVTHEEAEQALEDTERGTQSERRRRRRMRALQLINI